MYFSWLFLPCYSLKKKKGHKKHCSKCSSNNKLLQFCKHKLWITITSSKEIYIAGYGNNSVRILVVSLSVECYYNGYYMYGSYYVCNIVYTGNYCQFSMWVENYRFQLTNTHCPDEISLLKWQHLMVMHAFIPIITTTTNRH